MAVALTLSMVSCSTERSSVSEDSAVSEGNGESYTTCGGSYGGYESTQGWQMKLIAGDMGVYITLNESKAAADIVELLPLEMYLIEQNHFTKAMVLPRALDTQEETNRDYEIGGFGYWADGSDLAIFL